MTSAFETVLIHLQKLGFFELLPFMLSAAFFYGLLRKSKLFGEPEKNVAVNATVAITAAFMIWAYPFLSGVSLHEYELMFSSFFFNSLVATLVVLFGLLLVSMFVPEGLGKVLSEKFKGGGFWIGVIGLGIAIAVVVFLASTLSKVFLPSGFGSSSNLSDLFYSVLTLFVLVGVVAVVVWFTGKEEAKK